MTGLVNKEIQGLYDLLNSDSLEISIEYVYTPLVRNPLTEGAGPEPEHEERRLPHGTEADYASLFRLRTPGYERMPLEEFNGLLLEWCNEDYDRMERIGTDMFLQDYVFSLTEEEAEFAGLTAWLSREENYRRITAKQTGNPEQAPEMSMGRLQQQNSRTGAWCAMDVRFSWHVPDRSLVTVDLRDACVEKMQEKIRAFWEETSFSDLLRMDEEEVTALLTDYAKECSHEGIRLHVDEDMIRFEHRRPGE